MPAVQAHAVSANGRRPIVPRVDKWSRGPGAVLCLCGYNFDPIAWDWRCPHCVTTWPWRRRPDMTPVQRRHVS